MGRYPRSKESDAELKKGPWTQEEDKKLVDFIRENGIQNWQLVPKMAGLNRCGKSCRLRWTNYLRPDIRRGGFSHEEEKMVIDLHKELGNRWSTIAARLPGRTDNEVKNYYNTHLKKKLLRSGIDPITHNPLLLPNNNNNNLHNINHLLNNLPHIKTLFPNNSFNNNNPPIIPLESALRLQVNLTQIAQIQILQNIFQFLSYNNNNNNNSSNNNNYHIPLVQNVPMGLNNNNNVTTFDDFNNVGYSSSYQSHLIDPNSYNLNSSVPNYHDQPSPIMSNSLEFVQDKDSNLSKVLMNNNSMLPPLVPATPEPETSSSDQIMFPKGVMMQWEKTLCDDEFISAWEETLCDDEGNTSIFGETIFQ